MDDNILRLESVEFEDWGARRICGKLDVDWRTLIYGADPDALREIVDTIRRGCGLVEEALTQRSSLVCDWARSGSAALRFACGCSLRLESVPGEFEEHMAYDGYEGCEFVEDEDKEASFDSLAPAEFLLCDSHRATFDNPPDDEFLDLQLDYIDRYYGLPLSARHLRSALYLRRAFSSVGKDKPIELDFNFYNISEFIAAKKREEWTGYDTLVDEMRRVFPDFRGIEIVKTKFGEETVVEFLGAEPVDLCGMRPSELAFFAFLASIIDMRRTPLRKTNYLFYPDVECYLPPVAYDSFFQILNHTQQNVVATSSNPEFVSTVYHAAFTESVNCNFVYCGKERAADEKINLCQRTKSCVVNGDVFKDLVELGRKFVKLNANSDS